MVPFISTALSLSEYNPSVFSPLGLFFFFYVNHTRVQIKALHLRGSEDTFRFIRSTDKFLLCLLLVSGVCRAEKPSRNLVPFHSSSRNTTIIRNRLRSL